jgi:hypothetical protein
LQKHIKTSFCQQPNRPNIVESSDTRKSCINPTAIGPIDQTAIQEHPTKAWTIDQQPTSRKKMTILLYGYGVTATAALCLSLCCPSVVHGFVVVSPWKLPSKPAAPSCSSVLYSSDWSDFRVLEDKEEDDILMSDGVAVDRKDYAQEEDSQEAKAQIGASLDPPTIEGGNTEPLFVPPGSQLELSEENVLAILSACREEIGTMFGYTAENRGVGITGGVDFVELDGPSVVIRLKGRFWHQRTTVLDRVANYLQQRIPEIIDVTVEDEWQLTDKANEVF